MLIRQVAAVQKIVSFFPTNPHLPNLWQLLRDLRFLIPWDGAYGFSLSLGSSRPVLRPSAVLARRASHFRKTVHFKTHFAFDDLQQGHVRDGKIANIRQHWPAFPTTAGV